MEDLSPRHQKPWPVSEKQRGEIARYAAAITWRIKNGFDAWLLTRHRYTSVENIPDWHAAAKVIDSLRAMCRREHNCRRCVTACSEWTERYT